MPSNPSVPERPSKLLAEWFWTDRWIGSSAFLLPLEPRGLYREMLTQAWRRGGKLPNDHEAIKRAVGCTNAEWRRCWPKVERFWRVDGDSLINDTQADVIAETMRAHERAVERGRKGGKARAAAAQSQEQAENKQRIATPHLQDTGKPPSPSLSLSPVSQRAEIPGEHAHATDPDRVGAFMDWYAETHERLFGVGYLGTNSDYLSALKLVDTFSDIDLREGALVWFGQDDEFTKRGTRSIPKFASRASDCVIQARKVAS